MVVIKYPSMAAHAICGQDWMTLIGASYLFLLGNGDTSQEALNRRVDEAEALGRRMQALEAIPFVPPSESPGNC